MKSVRRSPRVSRLTVKSPAGRSDSKSRERPQSRSRSRRRSVSKEAVVQESVLSPLLSVNDTDFQNIQKKVVKGVIVDSFCWICHKSCDEIFCDTCPRAYHDDCFNKGKARCDCKQRKIGGRISHFILSPVELKEVLQYAIPAAVKDTNNANKTQKPKNTQYYSFFRTWPDVPKNQWLLRIIDLDTLIDKLNNTPPYQSTGHFYSDVKWIYHNCCIIYGVDNERTQLALKLQKNFLRELTDIEACHDCYKYKYSIKYDPEYNNTFTKVCRIDHPIVWAKLRGSPFWPAKCLEVHNGHADVRFFGTHDKSVIPLKQVYMLSRAHPEGKNINKMHRLKEAMDELLLYISNYEKKVGPFKFFEKKVPLCESPVKAKKRHYNRKLKLQAGVSEKKSVSVPVETKVKALLHLPFASSEGNVSGNPGNLKPVEKALDPTNKVVCQMTFTADEENPDTTSDDFMNNSRSENKLSSIKGASLSHTIPELHVLPSCSGLGKPAAASRRNQDNSRNVSAPFPIITSAHSTREDITNHIPGSKRKSSASISGSSSTSKSKKLPKNSLRNETSNSEDVIYLDDDDENDDQTVKDHNKNDVEMLKDINTSPLMEAFFKTPKIEKVLSEMVLSNKPRCRELYSLFISFCTRIFVSLLLEVNSSRINCDQLLNVQTFVMDVVKKMECYKKKYKDAIKELEEERAKNNVPQQPNVITAALMQAVLQRYAQDKKEVEDHYGGLHMTAEKAEEEIRIKDAQIKELNLQLEEKDQKIAEYLKELEQYRDRFMKNADDCQQNVSDNSEDSIYDERNDCEMGDSSGEKESDINCDVSSDNYPVAEPHQSYFTRTETGPVVLIQQNNISTISNSSSYNEPVPVLCGPSIVSSHSFPSSPMGSAPTTLLQLPVVVSSASMPSQSPSFLSSDIPHGYRMPSASGSSSGPQSDSPSHPEASGSKSSPDLNRKVTGEDITRKRRRD